MERELVRVDRNGTRYWKTRPECSRCGGTGIWTNGLSKGVCYGCGGEGYKDERIVKEYTPEHEAELEKRRIARMKSKKTEPVNEPKTEPVNEPKTQSKPEPETEPDPEGEHVGSEGEKIELNVTYEDYKSWETPFGWQRLYILRDATGNRLTWKTTAYISDNNAIHPGDTITIKATVKEHTINGYTNERETRVQRLKATKEKFNKGETKC